MKRTCDTCGYYKKLPDIIRKTDYVNFWSFLPWVEKKVETITTALKNEKCFRFGSKGSNPNFERHGSHFRDSFGDGWNTEGNCKIEGIYWEPKP